LCAFAINEDGADTLIVSPRPFKIFGSASVASVPIVPILRNHHCSIEAYTSNMATSNYCRQTSVPHIEEVPLIGGAAVPGPAVLDAPICGVEFFLCSVYK